MLSITRIFCCWHPDFVQDESGYRVLETGKYVVEWDEVDKQDKKTIFFKTFYNRQHFTKDFDNKEQAEKFMKTLYTKQKLLTNKKH